MIHKQEPPTVDLKVCNSIIRYFMSMPFKAMIHEGWFYVIKKCSRFLKDLYFGLGTSMNKIRKNTKNITYKKIVS